LWSIFLIKYRKTEKEIRQLLTEKYDQALSYASNLHRAQTRKGTEIPYVAHLISVSALVIEHGGTETQAIAALLHDAAEDQGGQNTLDEIRQLFGEDVASIVADCTDAWVEPKPEWRQRKEDYLSKLPQKPLSSLLVSLADKTHNAESIINDKQEIGDQIFNRFTADKAGTIWYYSELSRIFLEKLPGRLSNRLHKAVQNLS
jgi:(p)ppGpp synthase/HD superfamily hydrolase